MNPRDLEFFLRVADAGSFSQAAILLGKPQPALSKHVRDLESELRTPLLYRHGRGVVLTEAGRRLSVRARSILAQIDEARREAQGSAHRGMQSATIGMPPSVARLFAAPLASRLHAAYPHLRLRLLDAFNGHLLEWLTSGRLDAAILYACEASLRLNADPLLDEEMQLIGPGGDAALPSTVTIGALPGKPLLLPSQGHGLRAQIDSWALRNGLRLSVRTECDSLATLLELAAAGHGCTFLPQAALAREIEEGRLSAARVLGAAPHRRLVLALSPGREHGMELARVIKAELCQRTPDQRISRLRRSMVPNAACSMNASST